MANQKHNSQWLRAAFVVPEDGMDDEMVAASIFTPAANIFQDTTLGGNFAINTLPQFSIYTDPPDPAAENSPLYPGGKGMGRYYYEAYDSNAQDINFQFGVPQFNSLTDFFSQFYSVRNSGLVRNGRGDSVLFKLFSLAGYVLTFPLHAYVLVGTVVTKFLFNKPLTKFYYLKETMPIYWNGVGTMLNRIAGNMGLVPDMRPEDYATDARDLTNAQIQNYRSLLPDIFRTSIDGNDVTGIDVYAISTRAQRYAMAYEERLNATFDSAADFSDLRSKIKALNAAKMSISPEVGAAEPTLANAVARYLGTDRAKPDVTEEEYIAASGTNVGTDDKKSVDEPAEAAQGLTSSDEGSSDPSNWWNHLMSQFREGGSWLTLRTDYGGALGESFSTSTTESEVASKMNSVTNTSRITKFNIAGGNIGSGVVASSIETALGMVRDVIEGTLNGVGLGGLMALAGNGYVDIPKIIDQSTANLPTETYTIKLRSPAGDPLSRFQSLYFPLACILMGALPRSVGPQSYYTPFMCQVFGQGRLQIRNGVISSVQITRGVGNVGFNQSKQPLGIDVQITVTDLSNVLHVPVTAGMTPIDLLNTDSIQNMIFGDETAYGDYMATLTGVGMIEQVFVTRRLRRNFRNALLDLNQWRTPSHFAQWVANGNPAGRLVQALSRATDRP